MRRKFQGKGLSKATLDWLNERSRPGHWVEISPSDKIPSDIVGWDRTTLNMFQIYFGPEIRCRLNSGKIDDSFVLFAAQMIQDETEVLETRLNEEVRGVAVIKTAAENCDDQRIDLLEMIELISFDLEESELDYGHFTLLWQGSGWSGSFDFRSGRTKSAQFLTSAQEFLQAAEFAVKRELSRPAIDNLFSACELLAKAELILDPQHRKISKTHGPVHSAINRRRKSGNTSPDFVSLYNKMANARSPARYDAASAAESPTQEELALAQRQLLYLQRSVAQRS